MDGRIKARPNRHSHFSLNFFRHSFAIYASPACKIKGFAFFLPPNLGSVRGWELCFGGGRTGKGGGTWGPWVCCWRERETWPPQHEISLGLGRQGSRAGVCKGSDRKYFTVLGPHDLLQRLSFAVTIWKQPRTIHKQMSVAVSVQVYLVLRPVDFISFSCVTKCSPFDFFFFQNI